MLRSCSNSLAAALQSVTQAVGTSGTGAFSLCSSGAKRGTGCFCRLDRIRSLAELRQHQMQAFLDLEVEVDCGTYEK